MSSPADMWARNNWYRARCLDSLFKLIHAYSWMLPNSTPLNLREAFHSSTAISRLESFHFPQLMRSCGRSYSLFEGIASVLPNVRK